MFLAYVLAALAAYNVAERTGLLDRLLQPGRKNR